MPTPSFFKRALSRKSSVESTRSDFEADVLDDLQARGVAYIYEPRDGKLPYVTERLYIPDIVLPNGIIVEVKGFFLREDRAKMLAVREQNPGVDIRFVFQNWNSPVEAAKARRDGTKLTCREWCETNNFLCANKVVPDYWLQEQPKEDATKTSNNSKRTSKRKG